MTHLVQHYGLILLAGVILLEALGLPLPGETALIAAALLASRGKLDIVAVIIVSAVSAEAGGLIGFELGRRGGRRLLHRLSWLERWSRPGLDASERFFKRHGAKTVFVARFLPVLRVTAAWMAGLGKMRWWVFAVANAVGSVAWAVTVGLVVYWAGDAAAHAIQHYGAYAAIAIGLAIVVVIAALHVWRKRLFA